MIGWELTLRCNLRCRHCGSSAGSPRSNELTTKEALALCDQFPDLLVQEVDFSGGEPLLCTDWKEIVLHLKDLKIHTNILIHGLDLTADKVKEIADAGITCVGLSVDARIFRCCCSLRRMCCCGLELKPSLSLSCTCSL